MKLNILSAAFAILLPSLGSSQVLGSATNFGVLAGSAVTNTGDTRVHGNVGVWPGSSVTGFPPGVIVNGSIHANDAVAQLAQQDLGTAYDAIQGAPLTWT